MSLCSPTLVSDHICHTLPPRIFDFPLESLVSAPTRGWLWQRKHHLALRKAMQTLHESHNAIKISVTSQHIQYLFSSFFYDYGDIQYRMPIPKLLMTTRFIEFPRKATPIKAKYAWGKQRFAKYTAVYSVPRPWGDAALQLGSRACQKISRSEFNTPADREADLFRMFGSFRWSTLQSSRGVSD